MRSDAVKYKFLSTCPRSLVIFDFYQW